VSLRRGRASRALDGAASAPRRSRSARLDRPNVECIPMSSLATPGPLATSSRTPPSCYAKSLGSPIRSQSFDRFRSAATSRAFRERLAYALAAEKVPEVKALDMLVAGTENVGERRQTWRRCRRGARRTRRGAIRLRDHRPQRLRRSDGRLHRASRGTRQRAVGRQADRRALSAGGSRLHSMHVTYGAFQQAGHSTRGALGPRQERGTSGHRVPHGRRSVKAASGGSAGAYCLAVSAAREFGELPA
jgi:hypothetical protein